MPFTPPSATPAEKKKQEIMQQVIQKTVGVVDILARTMVDSALGRTYDANGSSSYDVALSKTPPERQPYKLSTPTLVDFIQKIVWPNTYVFDSGWTEPPNQEKKGGAMRGIGITAATETTNIFGTAIINSALKTSWYKNATTETQKAIIDLDKLYREFINTVPLDDEGKKNVVYTFGSNDLIGSLFYTYFLCNSVSGYAITLMANDPYMGYLFADVMWNSGPNSIISKEEDDLGSLGIAYQPTQKVFDRFKLKDYKNSPDDGYVIGTNIISNLGNPFATGFAKERVGTDIPFDVKIDDKNFKDELSKSAKSDRIFRYAPFWLLARQRQIAYLTSNQKQETFDTFFKNIETRLGFVPFSMDAFKNQATRRLGLEGNGDSVSNLSMLAIIGELLCTNTKSMFTLNEYEKKFLAMKYAQYSNFEISI